MGWKVFYADIEKQKGKNMTLEFQLRLGGWS